MANLCDNKFYFSTDNNFEAWKEKLQDCLDEHFEYDFNFDYNDSEHESGWIEGWFESKWVFPIEVFEDLIPDIEEDSDRVFFRCLSEEYGCGYVAMNIYSNGEWWDEQTFDL